VRLSLVTPPALEPLDLGDAKEHCRVDTSEEDRLIYAYIGAARRYVEEFTNRQLITATWELWLDHFPCGCGIEIPLPPLQSVVSVKYLDTAGVEQTLATSEYIVDTPAGEVAVPGRLTPAYSVVWPSTHPVINSVKVQFIAGYGLSPLQVPQGLKSAIREYVATLYQFREDDITGTISTSAPIKVDRMLWPFRSWRRAA